MTSSRNPRSKYTGGVETRETAGALEKLYSSNASDEARLEHGAVLFESLSVMFGGRLTRQNSRQRSGSSFPTDR